MKRWAGAVALGVAVVVSGCGPGQEVPEEPRRVVRTPASPQGAQNGPDLVDVTLGGPEEPADVPPSGQYPRSCPVLFDSGVVQAFHVELDPADWAAMQEEYFNHAARNAQGLPSENYYPVKRFRHGAQERTGGVHLRLRGNPTSWFKQDKFQFQISFDEVDKKGRYRGLRKLVLDAAHDNTSLMRDRLATSIYHDLGLPSSCVNFARLYVNGEYYGAYQHIEKVDKEFLERNFPNPEGELYKEGQILKTNRSHAPDPSTKDAFWAADGIEALEAVMDVEQFVTMLAVEAAFPNADGFWSGGWNFYLYDDPDRDRLVYLPWDMDLAFDNLPADTDPLRWRKSDDHNGRPQVELVLNDPKWRRVFVQKVREVRERAQPEVLQARIDYWAEQLAPHLAEDPHRPFTLAQHQAAVARLRRHVEERAAFLDRWLPCAEADPHAVCPWWATPFPRWPRPSPPMRTQVASALRGDEGTTETPAPEGAPALHCGVRGGGRW